MVHQERLETLASILADEATTIEDLRARYGPGSFGYHEVLHVSSIAADMMDSHILRHPSVVLDPELYALAHAAHTSMLALYQQLGMNHPTDMPE